MSASVAAVAVAGGKEEESKSSSLPSAATAAVSVSLSDSSVKKDSFAVPSVFDLQQEFPDAKLIQQGAEGVTLNTATKPHSSFRSFRLSFSPTLIHSSHGLKTSPHFWLTFRSSFFFVLSLLSSPLFLFVVS